MAKRHIYNISSDAPFLQTLALGLLERDDGNLLQALVLLPTRRACRSLREAFLDINFGKPVLLPRMQPLGDVDQEELELHLTGIYGVKNLPYIAPAMPELKRQILLSKLVQAYDASLNYEQALRLAGALSTLIDQTHTENLSLYDLQTLVTESDLADHWQLTLKFLNIVMERWPEILAREGEIDAADRRNRLMKTLSSAWADQPPLFPIVAAGSTGSISATADLLDTISTLPKGAVVLPGLDQDLDQESWELMGDTHPQATLRTLLNKLQVNRPDVSPWPGAVSSKPLQLILAREIMRPAETISSWSSITQRPEEIKSLEESLSNIEIIETKTLSDEAQTIAVIMKESLEKKDQTLALVTPDRELARRVTSALKKWQIKVDDSAGQPLSVLPIGEFIEFTLSCVIENFDPLSLINLLKHPLCRIVKERETLYDLEISICRGPRPRTGLQELKDRAYKLPDLTPQIISLIEQIEIIFQPLILLRIGAHPSSTFIEALISVINGLATQEISAWRGDAGAEAASLLTSLKDYGSSISDHDLRAFQDILRYFMDAVTIRSGENSHPRLLILGQLEARMIHSDIMILGGMNEGSWPAEAKHDPWMSRPMRRKFGLPSPERSIGLSAHDFSQALCSSKVILTRSLKVDGVPTVPSRWLQRLRTLIKAADITFLPNTTYSSWARLIQQSGKTSNPATRPEPCPPVSMRPVKLSATAIERWMRNPYHIYVTKILDIAPLPFIYQDNMASEKGALVHNILEKFMRTVENGPLPDNAYQTLLDLGEVERRNTSESVEWQVWWPRFKRLAAWFIANENAWRSQANPWLFEKTGVYTFKTERGSFTLTAKADRIDRLIEGGAAIIDYKTGTPPNFKSIESGESCQLPLEGLILREGGYGEALEPKILAHWQISGGTVPGKVKRYELDPTGPDGDLITQTSDGLKRLVAAYDQPDTPYISHPPKGPRIYDEEKAIAHLARVSEWGNINISDDEIAE